MGKVWKGFLAAAMLALVSAGCQNKMYDENKALHEQNRELQAQLDESHRNQAVAQPPQQPVVQQPVVQTQPQETVTPPNNSVARAPKQPDVGGLESTSDPLAGTRTIYLPSDISFGSGQAILQEPVKKSLNKVVAALKKEYAGKPIRVEGHTDTDPIKRSHWKSNQELSEKRAEAVRDYLVSKGIDASRITTQGFGETKPRDPNNKARNRRVEIVVVTK